ncbi:pyridoxamine 5'-phosphate oxidase family protein [Flaviaesturariibacter terrae]
MNPEEIESFLRTQLVGRIGCHADGITYVVPISYTYDGSYIYCHSAPGRKIDMMRKNPNICFQTDEFTELANWKSVIAQGVFEEITSDTEVHAAVHALVNRYLPIVSSETMHLGRLWPFEPASDEAIEGILFRISLTEKSGCFESDSQSPCMVG